MSVKRDDWLKEVTTDNELLAAEVASLKRLLAEKGKALAEALGQRDSACRARDAARDALAESRAEVARRDENMRLALADRDHVRAAEKRIGELAAKLGETQRTIAAAREEVERTKAVCEHYKAQIQAAMQALYVTYGVREHDELWQGVRALGELKEGVAAERLAKAERALAAAEARLAQVLKACPKCGGAGKYIYESGCRYCGDSGEDHECVYDRSEVECEQCRPFRALAEAPPTEALKALCERVAAFAQADCFVCDGTGLTHREDVNREQENCAACDGSGRMSAEDAVAEVLGSKP